ncbi:hypothetical protein LCGC14_1992840 [marine sediment metagenome]|uniref:Uncharacterized protein n=1 Tax=marine sediment metagenome TaxID=412755 RepID=A0A0F9FTM1_9ZZZZ
MKDSGKTAKERLQADAADKLEPYKGVLKSANIQCDLERQIELLEHELALTQQQLAEAQASNDNWRAKWIELVGPIMPTVDDSAGPEPIEAMLELARNMKPVVVAMRKAGLI